MATAQKQEKIDVFLMYVTHDAFRRDLERLAAAAASGRTGNPGVRAGWENFKRQLHVHHTVEDNDLWPQLERAVADRPADLALVQQMKAEHAALDPVLDRVDEGIAAGARDLVQRVAALAEVLGGHMKHEEESALPLIQEVLTLKDWGAFRGGMARMQGPKGAAVYVPWILDDLGPDGQRKFLAQMPAPVGVANKLLFKSRYEKRKLWNS